jgi:CBS domain-containing protein/uncharacterized protein (DUF2267 family)
METDITHPDLQSFLDKKVVTLPENATVEEAAKAMANQRVGCVVIKGRHKIVGVVTDRDIACFAVAEDLAPETAIEDIIAVEECISVFEDSDLDEVIDKMIRHGVRRIPVIRQAHPGRESCIGIVTLDDLILSGAIDIRTVREIIKPQVRTYDHHRSSRFLRRKEAKLEQSLNIFYKTLAREMEMDREEAEPHIIFILKSVVERISYTEAADLISSLPKLLQEMLWNAPSGPNKRINAEYILNHMQVRHGFTKPHAERIARGFWIGLELYLLNNEGNHILSQMPADMQILFIGEVLPKNPLPKKVLKDYRRSLT